MAVVIFNQTEFLDRYPEFTATVTAYPTSAKNCFTEAELFLNNTVSSRVPVDPRTLLLNMLTAHIMALNFGVNGKSASALVGRIASAGEGSVNVSVDMGPSTNQKAWYEQTKYGASYWRASMPWRSSVYVAPVGSGRSCRRMG